MTYKAYHLISLILIRLAGVSIILLGVVLERLGAGPAIWWPAVGWGIAVCVISLVFIGVTVISTSEMKCPDCGKKIVARVKLGLGSGHLYLSRKKEV
ncbi:hypothetical protein ACFLXK_05600 [Chloroflexota bacterium]